MSDRLASKMTGMTGMTSIITSAMAGKITVQERHRILRIIKQIKGRHLIARPLQINLLYQIITVRLTAWLITLSRSTL